MRFDVTKNPKDIATFYSRSTMRDVSKFRSLLERLLELRRTFVYFRLTYISLYNIFETLP